MQYIDVEELLKSTNGGLDIILSLYPDAGQSVHLPNRKFKIREEKTASAKLNRLENGTYVVYDHGGDLKNLNGIHCYMHENGLSFPEALEDLAKKYNLTEGITKEQEKYRAVFSERPSTADEAEGSWIFDIRNSFTDKEIETVFSANVLKSISWKSEDKEKSKSAYSRIASVFKEYRWHPLVSYTLVKGRRTMTFSSTEDYPIFLIDEGTHKKIYQPRHLDKGMRFMYEPGTKPKNFLHGFEQLKKKYSEKVAAIEAAKNDAKENADRVEEDIDLEAPAKKTEGNDPKFEKIFYCTGGSDALNIALVYSGTPTRVVWPNSETAKLSDFVYKELKIRAHKIYIVPDLDKTGQLEAHRLSMQFLDLYTVSLPEELLRFKDARNNPCKDVRDYFNHYKFYDFEQLVKSAMQYQFWESVPKYDRKGNFKNYGYELKNTRIYNFLQKNGFYRYMVGDKETEWKFIKITDNIVKFINGDQIRDFIKVFLRDRREDENLRDAVFSTPKINDSSLANIDVTELAFKDYTKKSQVVFFKNTAVEVTAEEILKKKHSQVNCYVWENDVIDHGFNLLKDAPFKITSTETGGYDIEVLHTKCLFFNYLINTSRSHWRKELEKGEAFNKLTPEEKVKYALEHKFSINGKNLDEDEIAEQKQHLINKIFVVGYLLHRYKDASKPWMIFAMDGHNREDFLSHGRTGKSLLFDGAIPLLLKNNFHINGRNQSIDKDEHKYHGITEFTRYVHIEDAHQYLNLDVFFNDISGKLEVNPKNLQKFTIPFQLSPKFALTTNYTGRNLGGSLMARLLNTVFSDYYHEANHTNDYIETRSPRTEFGMNLFEDFDRDQSNSFYNTMLFCLQFYLQTNKKLEPNMSNVTRRQLRQTMGENFVDWADIYFSEESGRLNDFVVREMAFKDHNYVTGTKNLTAHKFLEKIKAYCQLNGYELNPEEFRNSKGAIIKRVAEKKYDAATNTWWEVPGADKPTKEMLFIRTPQIPVPAEINVEPSIEPRSNNDISTEQTEFPI